MSQEYELLKDDIFECLSTVEERHDECSEILNLLDIFINSTEHLEHSIDFKNNELVFHTPIKVPTEDECIEILRVLYLTEKFENIKCYNKNNEIRFKL